MESSVSLKNEIWFLCVCHHISNTVYCSAQQILEALFFNYKGTFSIILLAVVDANYLFKYVHIGMQGRTCDGDVFLHGAFYNALTSIVLNVPQLSVLPGNDTPVPYVLVADVFPLTSYLVKPYAGQVPKGSPKRLFNYRLSEF
jgi:hypothetical protein